MTGSHDRDIVRRSMTRRDIELILAVAWNGEGARRGLLPLAWHLDEGDYLRFIGSADAYAVDRRRDIVEAWIADIGLTDDLDSMTDALQRRGPDMVWTGDIGGVAVEFRYPVASRP